MISQYLTRVAASFSLLFRHRSGLKNKQVFMIVMLVCMLA